VKFYSALNLERPVRLSEVTRRFAYESLHARYGQDTMRNLSVTLDHIKGFENMTSLEKYDAAIYEIASHAPIRICDNELISGAATLGLAIKHLVPATYHGDAVCESISHLTLGFEKVVRRGLDSIIKEIDISLASKTEQRNIDFLNSMKHCIDCIKIWHKRYLEALKEKEKEKLNTRFELIRKNLERVPFKPAEHFYDAVQSLWFLFAFTRLCGNWSGIGRIDVILGDYLKKDLRDGILTIEQAREILAHFFIKGCEWIRGENCVSGDAQHYQNIVLSGIDENGNDVTNEVTYLVLDIIEELGISDFPISIRVSSRTDNRLLTRMAETIRHGGGVVAVYNEDLILEALTDFGYPKEEAAAFANDGCWEVQIPGKTKFRYIPFDGLNVLQIKVLKGYDRSKVSFESFEELCDSYNKAIKDKIEQIYNEQLSIFDNASVTNKEWKWNPAMPCTVVSLFTEDCIEKGLSYLEGGAKYTVVSPHFGGLPDVANSLYAIKKLVFEDKMITLGDFLDVLKNDWKGYEVLRQYVLNHYEYYGNDNDEVDNIATNLLNEFADAVLMLNGRTPIIFPPGVSTFGRQLEWAKSRSSSPHGRKKGEVLAGNLSPTPGSDTKGATAIIKSYCKADLKKQVNGAALDIRLFPTTVTGVSGLEAIKSLIEGFIRLGGFFMQLDVIDAEVLKRAQQNPEEYKTLSVRVSGWSARFVTLDENWQNMIIERTAGRG
jgi:pyruvate-formate lyase